MAKTFGATVIPQIRPPNLKDLQSFKFVEARCNGGMNTVIDPADIPTNTFQKLKNVRVRFDKTSRRPGTSLIAPTKPDSNTVLGLFEFKTKVGGIYLFRFTPTTIYSRSSPTVWTAVTGTLTGTSSDHIRTASVLDSFIFTNNGVNNVQIIDPLLNTFGNLGDAPAYRYVTGFFNRAVGAARANFNEVEVGWSGDGNITEWNPATDETAGSSPILESPADLSDFITGIFGFSTVMILMREHSVWLATKQPVPQDPFNFYAAVPGIGCDSPNSIAVALNALVWFDRRTRTVWYYEPGQIPQPIGRPIENTIINGINDPNDVIGSYNPITNEYTVCIPQVRGKYNIAWTYNFRTQAWSFDEFYDVTSINDLDFASAGITIDELGDVPIDVLGLPAITIDELSPASEIIPTRVYGRGDGEIMLEDDLSITDPPHADLGPAGQTVPTQMVSKTFVIPELDMYIAEVVIEYQAAVGGSFTLEYSKNGGASEDSWVTAKTITVDPLQLGRPQLLRFIKQIKTRRYAWRLSQINGLFDLLSYEIHVYPSGKSKR